jgi:hypothetical protein
VLWFLVMMVLSVMFAVTTVFRVLVVLAMLAVLVVLVVFPVDMVLTTVVSLDFVGLLVLRVPSMLVNLVPMSAVVLTSSNCGCGC